MKKIIIPILSLIFLIVILLVIIWFNIPNIVSKKLSQNFGVPVSIENITFSKGNAKIKNLVVGNPKESKTSVSFSTKVIDINSTIKDMTGKVLTIDSIVFDNIFIGIEFYNKDGSSNNWATIMKNKPKESKKNKTPRKYLIKTLTLNNISVALTKTDGIRQTFPSLSKLEFYNITDETGFPIDEIEKAIANAILRSIFQKYALEQLLKTISPSNFMDRVIPFPFFR
ncbi:MAG: hypothetical protein JXA94_00765 [Parachlamydiales bacterium]|nr:hypothetical protein [Parachlamydiales bacterium]